MKKEMPQIAIVRRSAAHEQRCPRINFGFGVADATDATRQHICSILELFTKQN
jgi:hypothetical protein